MTDLVPRRWLYLLLVALSTGLAVFQLWSVFRVDGLEFLEGLILVLFAILFAWISASFWLAVFGMLVRADGMALLPLAEDTRPSSARTAIIMPVYNEDVGQAFSRMRAIHASTGPGFDFYILSDSTNPAFWVAEELEWQKLREELGTGNVYYRHRSRNVGRKSGNIQDFCENWGPLYDYMVILDADSLMSEETLNHLVGLMDASPKAALIQTQAQLVGRNSLFARLQQFSSSAYGPIYASGLAALQGPDGNYFGHNAIIRVRAFMAHCGLPKLPGRPPFGGEIMSHDFIEAAFLRRAGWEVWMAPDLPGSYEEPPPTIHDFLKRDRRWCQGNLQHFKVIFAQGLKMPSRLHLAMGIMSYLSSPLWLLLLITSAIEMMRYHEAALVTYNGTRPALSLTVSHAMEMITLVLATLVLLYTPKILAVANLFREKHGPAGFGGRGALIRSVLAESLFSTLFAPIVMLQHSWYVFIIVAGISTGWGAQQRDDRVLPLSFVFRAYAVHTLIGLCAGAALLHWAPSSFGWFVPLLAGMALAIPLVWLTSSLALGEYLRARGLFITPNEKSPPPVLSAAHALMASRLPDPPDVRRLLLEDARVRDLHLALLNQNGALPPTDREKLAQLVTSARARQTAAFTSQDWADLLSDPESLRALAIS